MTVPVVGWDIGGANVKAAFLDDPSQSVLRVAERPFAIWREPLRLPALLTEMAGTLPPSTRMAVTMTAELADCFATKREGVAFVLDAVKAAFPRADVHVYGVDGRFHAIDEAKERPLAVAAANWRATAAIVARRFPDALVIDVGSTTSDIVPIVDGSVTASGRTDTERLVHGELVYTGALRTPVCAIARFVPVAGARCRVAAEHFAIAADVHRWLERIGDADYACDTPDGRGRSRSEAGARLARMVCADLETLNPEDITEIAAHVAGLQVRQIAGAVRQVMRRLNQTAARTAVLVGQGTFLGRAAADRAGLHSHDFGDELGPAAARSAPAAAVAMLLAEESLA
jgi:(4-(4-[2-(gamma-L-glutamylamino)ethyl]phenoxymethyl)furan-2-yl)methanamine synthase